MSGSGFDLVEHRIGQITGSFGESRNLLAEIEENLHALKQLRRGESDRIAEVDTELLRCSSSVQGGLDRIARVSGIIRRMHPELILGQLKGNGVIATDGEFIFSVS